MLKQLICIVFVNIILCLNKVNSNGLKLVQIVQRHGDRNPTNFYPNDIYKNESYWPEGIGELTARGKTRMFEFGVTLRNRYSAFLGDSPREVTIKSSSATRTLESAETFIAGLYKPSNIWIWNNDTQMQSSRIAELWQPIPVATNLAANDGLLRTTANCPKADQIWNIFMQSNEVRDYVNQHKEFIEKLSKNTGDQYWSVKPSPLRPLEFLSTTLRIERESGLKMPEWADTHTLQTLRDLELHAFYYDWNDKQIQRLRAGVLIEELTRNMINKADDISNKNQTNGKKLYLFETHDVNQVVLMQALGVYESIYVNRTPPTYTASLVFELYQKNEEFIVKLLYFNDIKLTNTSTDDFVELGLVKCDLNLNCTLHNFLKSVEDLIPLNWDEECERLAISSESSYQYFNAFSLVYLFAGIIFGFLCMSFVIFFYKRKIQNLQNRDENQSLNTGNNKKYSKN